DAQRNDEKRRNDGRKEEDQGEARHGHNPASQGELHREPPFEGGPGRPLPRPSRSLEQLIDVWRDHGGPDGAEPVGEEAVETRLRGHARRPSGTAPTRASASTAPRSAWMARWSRDFAVPIGTPRRSAASGSG